MSCDVSKMTRKELEERLINTEKLLCKKAMLEKLPDRGKKLLDSQLQISNELKFRKDMERTTATLQNLFLSKKGRPDLEAGNIYAHRRAEFLDNLAKTKKQNKPEVQRKSFIKNLSCKESLNVIIEKGNLSDMSIDEKSMLSKQSEADKKFINYREVQSDSDDDDGEGDADKDGEEEKHSGSSCDDFHSDDEPSILLKKC